MKNDEPMRNINPFGLRLQPDLKAKLEEAAKQNKRSLNAEISARLESTFPASAGTLFAAPQIAQTLATIERSRNPLDIEEADRIYLTMRERLVRAIDDAIAEAIPVEVEPSSPKKPAYLGMKRDPHGKVPAKITEAETIRPASKRITRSRKPKDE
jgi:hypothetical protein